MKRTTAQANPMRAARLPGGVNQTMAARSSPKQGLQKLQQRAGNRAMNSLLPQAERAAEQMANQLVGAEQTGLGQPVGQQPDAKQVVAFSDSGSVLPEAVKGQFAPMLGKSVNDIRIHTGDEAQAAARSLGARAFTQGQDIGFARGQFDVASAGGIRLLAHEIGHAGQTGVHLFPDKEEQKKPTALEKIQTSLDAAFKNINSDKAADVTKGLTQLRTSIAELKKAATVEKADDQKAKMEHVAQVLEALAVTIEASQKKGGQSTLRGDLDKKKGDVLGGEQISQGKIGEAAGLYKNVTQEFTDLFPKIAFDSGLLVAQFTSAVSPRLAVMEGMDKAGAGPTHYPPTPDEVGQYFSRLGLSGAKNDEITQAYTDYTYAFFEYTPTEFNPKSMDAAAVYGGKMAFFGSIHTDCDGYVRLGISLLTKAGFKLEAKGVHVGVRNHKLQKGTGETYDDAHAIALLSRNGQTVYLSNRDTFGGEDAAFNVNWLHPDADLTIGKGNNLQEALQDVLKLLGNK